MQHKAKAKEKVDKMSVFDLLSDDGKRIMKEVIKNLSNTNNTFSIEEHEMDERAIASRSINTPIQNREKEV